MNRIRNRAEQRRRGSYLGARIGKSLCFAQHDYVIDNASGGTVRSDVNSALSAIATWNSGASAPATMYARMRWVDTTLGVIKRRNAANSGWLIESTDDETRVMSRSSNTILDESDIGKTVSTTGTYSQTFTAAATLGDGWWVLYRNDGTGVITLDPNASELIDGATTFVLYPGTSCIIVCTGAAFKTVGLGVRGSFTASLTGCTAGVTGTAYYSIVNNVVQLDLPVLTGTSNTTACTITGIPADIQAASTKQFVVAVMDNSASIVGSFNFPSGGTLTLGQGANFSGLFTGSGTKGLPAGASISYTKN